MIASLVQATLIVLLALIMAASGGITLIAAASLTFDRAATAKAGLLPGSCLALGAIGLVVFILAACNFAPLVMR